MLPSWLTDFVSLTSSKVNSAKNRIQSAKKQVTLNVIISGATIVAILSILLALLAFNAKSYSKNEKFGTQFEMLFDPTEQLGHVWVYLPRPIYVKSTIMNLLKVKNGVTKEAGVFDIFPVRGKSSGSGTLMFEIYAVEEQDMQSSAGTRALAPTAYVRKDKNLPSFIRYMMVVQTTVFNNWTTLKYLTWTVATGCIIAGILLRTSNRKSRVKQMKLKDEVNNDKDNSGGGGGGGDQQKIIKSPRKEMMPKDEKEEPIA